MPTKTDVDDPNDISRLEKYLKQTSSCKCKTADDHVDHLVSKTPNEMSLDPLASVLKAASVPKRLQILFLLMDAPRCICELESVLHVSQPTITHHIRIMQRVGIIETRRENKWLVCSLKDETITNTIVSLNNYLESKKPVD